jgi:lysophospholipase L1-like esterase
MSMTLGAIAVLAATEPAPRAEGSVQALATEQEPAVRVSGIDVATPPVSPLQRPLGPGDPTERSDRSRPDVAVAQPSPGVAPRLFRGATAVFLGDSYTTGWNGAGLGSRGWPALVARSRDWRTVNLAVAGTGFINPGWTNQPVGARVSATIRQKPDVVFIAAGHNDSRWSAAATARAAAKVIHRLRRALPDAVLVIVAPIWPSGSPPTRCLVLRDHLRRTARSVDAIFVDSLAEGWYAGNRQKMIGRDGIHPSDAGHRFMAKRVLAAIAAAG